MMTKLILLLAFCLGCTVLPTKNIHLHLKKSDPGKICVIGDTGTGSETQTLIANHLAKENCEAIFLVGDIIYPSGIKNKSDYQLDSKFFNPYREIISASKPIPIFLQPGNHDYQGSPYAWVEISEQWPNRLIMPHLYYSGSWKNICFVSLDTNLYNSRILRWKYASHLKNQEQWLKQKKYKFSKNCKLKLAFGHHPYKSSGWHGSAKNKLKKFFDDFIIGKFDFYISGHDHHLSFEGHVKNTSLMISGAGAKLRPLKTKHSDKDHKFNASVLGYLVLDIKQKNRKSIVNYYFRGLKGQQMETLYQGTISK